MTKVLIWITLIIAIGAIVAAVVWNPLAPSIASTELKTAKVEIGSVIKTVPANGVVEPANEVLLLSPAPAIVVGIRNGVGSKVKKGDVILKLDDRPIRDKIESIEDQIEVKNNNLEKTLLNDRNIRVDLAYNVEVKKLKIASIKSELADQEQLLEVGGISPAKYEKTKQELTLAEKDLETIQVKNHIRLKQLAAEEKGLKLQIEIQEKQLTQQKELLYKMIIRAPSAGIILEINGKEGEKVSTDRLLVRMSDLTRYKLSASIEDTHANITKTGQGVFALVEGTKLAGKIGTISPTVNDGKIEFDVFLEHSSYSKLRPNMSLDLEVVESQKDSVLRVKKGPAFGESKKHNIYFKESGKALLKEVETGLSGSEYYEIREGAKPGDELIISDISSLRQLKEVELK
ncbi:efflux RND transporter periplasmic adaptor subunit [Fulvivirgaceae bacterium BMA12]|uniref:Efflux RND transporter periplasmic adaptor subunit n=1 Tax=Agaribacillus aureus TaxID=3051825 RepID=A0ABT8LAA7_9BACT|nr:efflux RND transporter periplasmic adaptor subunit [Fulvivirgaceae bacterium BMA12]